MVVTRKDNAQIDFGMLKNGDVFKDEHGVFLVIEDVENKNGGVYNAVDVECGELTRFYADEKVYLLHAELIVS